MELTDSDKIRALVESNLFEYLGLGSMSEEEQSATIEKLINNLNNRVSIRIADFLEEKSPELFTQFKEMLSKEAGTDEINKFLSDNQVPVDVFYGEEAIYLKSELMQLKR